MMFIKNRRDSLLEAQLELFIEKYGLPVVEIDANRNYWLVRTKAGEYFNEFYSGNYVAIGWNELNDFQKFRNKKKEDEIEKEIVKAYPRDQPGRIYGQIHRFLYEMQVGDIVMIPNENSKLIQFGIIEGEPELRTVTVTAIEEEGACPYFKKRKVRWIKSVRRDKLDSYLFRMMQSHLTISNANDYAHYIDRTLHSFFIKKDKAYLVLPVGKEGNTPAYDLVKFVAGIVDLVPEVNKLEEVSEEYKKEDLDLKINVQSRGFVEFFSNAPILVLGVGLFIFLFAGSKVELKNKSGKNKSFYYEGLLGRKFKDNLHELERKKEENIKNFEKNKAELPEEIINLLDKENRKE